jgi:transcriptional regulator with XRE-family HTH domain
MITFNEKFVQQIIAHLKIDKKRFGEDTDSTRQLVSNWATGKHHPTVKKIIQIMNVYKIDPSFFFMRNDDK